MQFLADVGVSQRVVCWLQEQGHDAVHLRDLKLQRLSDIEIFAKASEENRVVLTFDLDFGEIVAFSKGKLVSVILFRLNNTSTPFVIRRLQFVLAHVEQALRSGAVVVVEDFRHRVRRLPVSF